MASPSSPPPPAEKSKFSSANQPVPPGTTGGVFVSSAFIQTPLFSHQFLKPHKIVDAASSLVRKIDSSISANVEKCLNLVHLLASQNPLLNKISSITSEFNAVCQMQHRNNSNLNSLSKHNFAAVLPGDSVAGVVVTNGIMNFLNLYNTVLVARLVLTWFPNAPPAIVSPLSTLCDPYLNIFRGLIPPLGGLDLSPILAFLVLNAFTSAAAALPAELPPASPNTGIFDLTSTQKKWMKRLHSNKSKDSTDSK